MAAQRRALPAEAVIAAYKRGTSAKTLSEQHDCSQGAILRVLREAKVAIRPRGGRKRVTLPHKRLVRDYGKGLSTIALAHKHGCSASTVSRALVEAGVTLRPRNTRVVA